MKHNPDRQKTDRLDQSGDRAKGHLRPIVYLLLLGLAAWGFFASTSFSGLTGNDGYNYAASARSWLRGEGFIWECHQVQEFSSLPEGKILSRAALRYSGVPKIFYSMVLAPFLATLGQNDLSIVLAGFLFFLATIPLIYLLAYRLFGLRAGIIAGVLFILNAKMMVYTLSGQALSLYAFLLCAACLFIVTSPNWSGLLLAGVMAGLIQQTKGVGGIIALVILAYAAATRFSDLRFKAIAAVAVGWLIVWGGFQVAYPLYQPRLPKVEERYLANLTPESNDQQSAVQIKDNSSPSGYFLLLTNRWLNRARAFSQSDPDHTFERSLDNRPIGEAWKDPIREMIGKIAGNAGEILRIVFWELTAPALVVAFWAGGLIFIRHRVRRRLFGLVVLLFMVQGVVCSLLFVMHRYFHVFIPLLIVPAAGLLDSGFREIQKRLPGVRSAGANALLGLTLLVFSYPPCLAAGLFERPLYCDVQCWRASRMQGRRLAELGAFLRRHTEPDQVVVADAPWVAWWHGDRTSIWLPTDIKTMQSMQKRVQVDWLFLTFEYWRNLESWKQWLDLAGAGDGRLDGFRFVEAYVDGDYRAYLFRAELAESLEGDGRSNNGESTPGR